jgi:hypothetical protein
MRPEELGTLKTFIHLIESRNRDLPVCCMLPVALTTTLLGAPPPRTFNATCSDNIHNHYCENMFIIVLQSFNV